MTPTWFRNLAGALVCLAWFSGTAMAAEVVIGQVAPFSGPLAPTGSHMRYGAELYFSRVNASGGVNGAKLRMVSKDDGYDAAETVRLTRQLLKEARLVALFGVVGTGNVEALVKQNVLSDAGVPLIAIRSGASTLIEPVHPLVFMTRASYAKEIGAIVRQFTSVGATRLAIFYQDDPFGLDGLASAEAAIKSADARLVAKAAYKKNTTQVENAVNSISAAEPQGVIMISNTAASAEFVKQARAAGNDALLITLSVTDGPQVAQSIGKGTAHGLGIVQVVPNPGNRTIGVVKELQEDMKKYARQGVELNHTLLEGYVGAKILVEGLRRAGANPTPGKLKAALESIHEFDLGGMVVGFSSDNHAGSSYVDISILNRDGRLLR